MTIKLTRDKAADIKNVCKNLLNKSKPTIREVAKVIGKIVASFPGVMHGPLYYRALEKNKTQALKEAKGNFEATMSLSTDARIKLHWWESNVETSFQTLSHGEPEHVITTDASLSGWRQNTKECPLGECGLNQRLLIILTT